MMLVYTVAVDQCQQVHEVLQKYGLKIGTMGRLIADFNKIADALQEEIATLVEECSPGTASKHHQNFGEDYEKLKEVIENF